MAEIRKIITEEDPLLREQSVEVHRFGSSLHKLLDDMKVTMYQVVGKEQGQCPENSGFINRIEFLFQICHGHSPPHLHHGAENQQPHRCRFDIPKGQFM